jgi:hypothetical protein
MDEGCDVRNEISLSANVEVGRVLLWKREERAGLGRKDCKK